MYQEYLMHARQNDLLRTAAKDQTAAQARRARAARRHQTETDPVNRWTRALKRLAHEWARHVGPFSAQSSNDHEEIALRHIDLTARPADARKPVLPAPGFGETTETSSLSHTDAIGRPG